VKLFYYTSNLSWSSRVRFFHSWAVFLIPVLTSVRIDRRKGDEREINIGYDSMSTTCTCTAHVPHAHTQSCWNTYLLLAHPLVLTTNVWNLDVTHKSGQPEKRQTIYSCDKYSLFIHFIRLSFRCSRSPGRSLVAISAFALRKFVCVSVCVFVCVLVSMCQGVRVCLLANIFPDVQRLYVRAWACVCVCVYVCLGVCGECVRVQSLTPCICRHVCLRCPAQNSQCFNPSWRRCPRPRFVWGSV